MTTPTLTSTIKEAIELVADGCFDRAICGETLEKLRAAIHSLTIEDEAPIDDDPIDGLLLLLDSLLSCDLPKISSIKVSGIIGRLIKKGQQPQECHNDGDDNVNDSNDNGTGIASASSVIVPMRSGSRLLPDLRPPKVCTWGSLENTFAPFLSDVPCTEGKADKDYGDSGDRDGHPDDFIHFQPITNPVTGTQLADPLVMRPYIVKGMPGFKLTPTFEMQLAKKGEHTLTLSDRTAFLWLIIRMLNISTRHLNLAKSSMPFLLQNIVEFFKDLALPLNCFQSKTVRLSWNPEKIYDAYLSKKARLYNSDLDLQFMSKHRKARINVRDTGKVNGGRRERMNGEVG